MEERNYTVYMHRNKINGKVYIGITGNDVNTRWNNGHGYRNNPHFHNAIKKYGWDGFEHIILHENCTKEFACSEEIRLIAEYDATNTKVGYNNSLGGDHGTPSEHTKEVLRQKCSGWRHSEDAKRKISEAGKGRVFSEESRRRISESQIGKIVSEETRRKQSVTAKGRPSWIKGKHWTKEQRKKLSEAHLNNPRVQAAAKRNAAKLIGTLPVNAREVICVETGERYESATAAAAAVGSTQTSLSEVCRVKYRTLYGKHWRYVDECPDLDNIEIPDKPRKKGRSVLCVETGKIFKSAAEASLSFGEYRNAVSKAVNLPNRTAGGYHWQYV